MWRKWRHSGQLYTWNSNLAMKRPNMNVVITVTFSITAISSPTVNEILYTLPVRMYYTHTHTHTHTYLSGRFGALSSWPGTSMWMKIDLSLISLIQGWFTKSWNDESEIQNESDMCHKMVTDVQLMWRTGHTIVIITRELVPFKLYHSYKV